MIHTRYSLMYFPQNRFEAFVASGSVIVNSRHHSDGCTCWFFSLHETHWSSISSNWSSPACFKLTLSIYCLRVPFWWFEWHRFNVTVQKLESQFIARQWQGKRFVKPYSLVTLFIKEEALSASDCDKSEVISKQVKPRCDQSHRCEWLRSSHQPLIWEMVCLSEGLNPHSHFK